MIRKADLDNHLDNYPEITRRILADVTQRLQVSEKQTTQVGIENVASRIVAFLADYVVDENNHTFVDLPMTRKDLASYLGTTPETISRKFSALEEQDLIRQHAKNRIEIMDLDELLFSVE
jgi:CRP/FNR family transcriptional regulator